MVSVNRTTAHHHALQAKQPPFFRTPKNWGQIIKNHGHEMKETDVLHCVMVAAQNLFSVAGRHHEAGWLGHNMQQFLDQLLDPTRFPVLNVKALEAVFPAKQEKVVSGNLTNAEVVEAFNNKDRTSIRSIMLHSGDPPSITAHALLVYLSQQGVQPKILHCSQHKTRLRDNLNHGRPVLILDDDIFLGAQQFPEKFKVALKEKAEKEKDPNCTMGHAYVLYKFGEHYFYRDNNFFAPQPVSEKDITDLFTSSKRRALILENDQFFKRNQ